MNSKLSDTTTGQEDPKGGLLLLYALVLGLFCLFVVRFWYLQVLKGDYYTAKSRENRLRESSIYAPRGLIRERGGEILVSNEPAYALGLVREECVNVEKTLRQVSAWTGTDYDRMMDIYKRGKRKLKPFEPIILSQDIPFEVLAQIEANSLRWPGLEIITRRGRHYKQGVLMAHVLGYVAEANEEEMDKDPGLAMGDTVGKQGLEYVLEKRLRGVKGVRQVEVDATGAAHGRDRDPARPARRGRDPVHRPEGPAAGHGNAQGQDRGRGGHGRGHRATGGPGQLPVLRLQRLCRGLKQRGMEEAAGRRGPPAAEPGHPERVPARLGVQAGHGRGRPWPRGSSTPRRPCCAPGRSPTAPTCSAAGKRAATAR